MNIFCSICGVLCGQCPNHVVFEDFICPSCLRLRGYVKYVANGTQFNSEILEETNTMNEWQNARLREENLTSDVIAGLLDGAYGDDNERQA